MNVTMKSMKDLKKKLKIGTEVQRDKENIVKRLHALHVLHGEKKRLGP